MVKWIDNYRAVMYGAAIGETSRETAVRLGVPKHTVDNIRGWAIDTLKARNITHAVAIAVRRGIIDIH